MDPSRQTEHRWYLPSKHVALSGPLHFQGSDELKMEQQSASVKLPPVAELGVTGPGNTVFLELARLL